MEVFSAMGEAAPDGTETDAVGDAEVKPWNF